MIIRELLTRWGIEVDDTALNLFEEKLSGTVITAAAVGAAAVTAGAGLLKLAVDAATAGTGAAATAKNIGLTAESLQELRYAAKLFGVEAQDLDDSLKDLQDKASAAAQGDEGLQKTLKDLGINAKEFVKLTADKKLEQLADGLKKIDNPARAAQIRMELMSDAGFKMGGLLDAGSAGITKMRAEARDLGLVLREDAIKASQDFSGEMVRLRAFGEGLALQLGARLLPTIGAIVKEVRGWLMANRAVITSGLNKFVDAGAASFRLLWWVIQGVASAAGWLVDSLGGLNRTLFYTKFLIATFVTYRAGVALWGLAQAVAAAALAYKTLGASAAIAQVKAMLLPIAIAAAVVVLGLLIDDFDAFFSGQKSGIGELISKYYPELGGVLWAFHDAWVEAGLVAEEFFDWAIAAWPEFKDAAWEAVWGIIDGWNNLEAEIPAALERAKVRGLEIVQEFVAEIARRLAGVVGRVELVATQLGLDSPELRAARMGLEAVGTIQSGGQMAAASAAPLQRQTAALSAARGSTTTIGGNTFQLQQQPGEDAAAFSRRVVDEVDRRRASQLRQAAASVDAGITY